MDNINSREAQIAPTVTPGTTELNMDTIFDCIPRLEDLDLEKLEKSNIDDMLIDGTPLRYDGRIFLCRVQLSVNQIGQLKIDYPDAFKNHLKTLGFTIGNNVFLDESIVYLDRHGNEFSLADDVVPLFAERNKGNEAIVSFGNEDDDNDYSDSDVSYCHDCNYGKIGKNCQHCKKDPSNVDPVVQSIHFQNYVRRNYVHRSDLKNK